MDLDPGKMADKIKIFYKDTNLNFYKEILKMVIGFMWKLAYSMRHKFYFRSKRKSNLELGKFWATNNSYTLCRILYAKL